MVSVVLPCVHGVSVAMCCSVLDACELLCFGRLVSNGSSDLNSTLSGVKSKLKDYDTGVESADELEETDYESEFPHIANDKERLRYKRQFDRDHMEYKRLQAELDDINLGLAEVDRELDRLQEGSPQFLDAMEDYTRLKNLKRSADYQTKKKKTKQLKAKLAHLKKRVNDYDQRP